MEIAARKNNLGRKRICPPKITANLRLPKAVKVRAIREAHKEGISLSQYVSTAIIKSFHP